MSFRIVTAETKDEDKKTWAYGFTTRAAAEAHAAKLVGPGQLLIEEDVRHGND